MSEPLLSSHHSLVVVKTKHLRWLGLRSLKEVSAGKVMLKDNPELCYTQHDLWTRLFRSSDQVIIMRGNPPPSICGEFVDGGEFTSVFSDDWEITTSVCFLSQNNRIEHVTRSVKMEAAGVQVPPCVSPVCTLTVGGAVWCPVTSCRGESERTDPRLNSTSAANSVCVTYQTQM